MTDDLKVRPGDDEYTNPAWFVLNGETFGDWLSRIGWCGPKDDERVASTFMRYGGALPLKSGPAQNGVMDISHLVPPASPPLVEPPKSCEHWMEHGSPLCSRCGATQEECLRTGGYNSPLGWNPHGGGNLACTQQSAMGPTPFPAKVDTWLDYVGQTEGAEQVKLACAAMERRAQRNRPCEHGYAICSVCMYGVGFNEKGEFVAVDKTPESATKPAEIGHPADPTPPGAEP